MNFHIIFVLFYPKKFSCLALLNHLLYLSPLHEITDPPLWAINRMNYLRYICKSIKIRFNFKRTNQNIHIVQIHIHMYITEYLFINIFVVFFLVQYIFWVSTEFFFFTFIILFSDINQQKFAFKVSIVDTCR